MNQELTERAVLAITLLYDQSPPPNRGAIAEAVARVVIEACADVCKVRREAYEGYAKEAAGGEFVEYMGRAAVLRSAEEEIRALAAPEKANG